ncbi:hypothetical protein R5H30_01170 [Sulfitobacter sp. D35]|uniref:hypothetical protein n=1 Tax=Sulfitobacter sp. D35 TaxID=3083252 RepID=UPI00296EB0B4|nr:hypothetical protein [Sulfitobacter sp. D35]MDW4496575.1 hypothetical protein [Sulfitobacter sp. D35]
MFDYLFSETTELHDYIHRHSEALQNAALLLGGRPWLRRAQRLLDDFSTPRLISGRMRREIDKVYGLLTLRNVHDPDAAEAAYFAELDPTHSAVEEICALADGLADAAAAIGLELPDPTNEEDW